jgi:hypothetical protein
LLLEGAQFLLQRLELLDGRGRRGRRGRGGRIRSCRRLRRGLSLEVGANLLHDGLLPPDVLAQRGRLLG